MNYLTTREVLAALDSAKRYLRQNGIPGKRCIVLQISATDSGKGEIRWFGSDQDSIIPVDDTEENDSEK